MKLTLEALRILDAIDRNGSFGAAALELHKVRTALTYTINKLEQDLGVTLFDRSGHRAVLTQAGELLLHQGRHLLENALALEQRISHLGEGWEPKIRIAFDDVIDGDKLMNMFAQFFDACKYTELDIQSEILMGTWNALQNNQVDLAIGVMQMAPTSSQFATHTLGALEFIFAVSPHHPLASLPDPLSSETIMKYQSVVVADTGPRDNSISYGVLTGQKRFRVSRIREKLLAQIAGIGVGYLPRTYADAAIKAGLLVSKQVEKPLSKTYLSFAWRIDKQDGKAMQSLIKHLKKHGVDLLYA
jgi:DNA-binding transcriptional LysR family regulator